VHFNRRYLFAIPGQIQFCVLREGILRKEGCGFHPFIANSDDNLGLIINERIGQERQGVGMMYTLEILGETGGIALLLLGQTGHGRAGRSVLFSLCGSLEKVQDSAGIILRSLLIGVVAAFGEDSQLASWKVAVKSS
jgi:hypothetical protein